MKYLTLFNRSRPDQLRKSFKIENIVTTRNLIYIETVGTVTHSKAIDINPNNTFYGMTTLYVFTDYVVEPIPSGQVYRWDMDAEYYPDLEERFEGIKNQFPIECVKFYHQEEGGEPYRDYDSEETAFVRFRIPLSEDFILDELIQHLKHLYSDVTVMTKNGDKDYDFPLYEIYLGQ